MVLWCRISGDLLCHFKKVKQKLQRGLEILKMV